MIVDSPISLGELVDKISILRIKQKFILDKNKLTHIDKEEGLLSSKLNSLNLDGIDELLNQLVTVNSKLWKIEDDIREKERQKQFDQDFIDLARAVYVTNDERFVLKNQVNEKYGSGIVEIKSYEEY